MRQRGLNAGPGGSPTDDSGGVYCERWVYLASEVDARIAEEKLEHDRAVGAAFVATTEYQQQIATLRAEVERLTRALEDATEQIERDKYAFEGLRTDMTTLPRERDAFQAAAVKAVDVAAALHAGTPRDWETAALLKDRTRQAIRDRVRAGEPPREVALDYRVPEAFVAQLVAWQLGRDDAGSPPTARYERTSKGELHFVVEALTQRKVYSTTDAVEAERAQETRSAIRGIGALAENTAPRADEETQP